MAARARVLKQVGADKDEARYTVSPIEVVAAFQVPLPGGRTLDQDRISEAVAAAAGVGYRKIDPLKLDMALATRTVSKPYAQKHVLLPLERTEAGALVVAVANPFDRELLENLHRLAGMPIEPVLSAKADILKAIADIYGFKRTLAQAATDFAQPSGTQLQNFEQLVSLSGSKELDASDKPIVQAVDYLLRYAYDNRASDIHIEPKRDSTVVRLRIDGVLHPVYTLPTGVHPPIVSRVKMLSRIDISEKRRPQDGRIKTERDGREIELRVSTLPTAFGEKVVIRIFDPETLVQDIAQLGFDEDEKGLFESWIDEPHGLILVTGPTGSGKTTTLYSALKALAGPGGQRHHHRGPHRDGVGRLQPGPGAAEDRPRLRQRAPPHPPAGPGRHHGGRDPRRGDGGERDPGGAHRPPGALHPAHQRRGGRGEPDEGPGRAAVPALQLSAGGDGPAPPAPGLQPLRGGAQPDPGRAAGPRRAAAAAPGRGADPPGRGLRALPGHGLLRPDRRVRDHAGDPEIREAIAQGANTPELVQLARKAGMRTLREAAVRKLASGQTAFAEVVRMTASA